jgi:hypothetical protein
MTNSEHGKRQPGGQHDDDKREVLGAKLAAAREDAATARRELLGTDDLLTVAHDGIERDGAAEVCLPWYEVAAILYAGAAAAYAQGDGHGGLMYELSAASHLAIGHACSRAAGG